MLPSFANLMRVDQHVTGSRIGDAGQRLPAFGGVVVALPSGELCPESAGGVHLMERALQASRRQRVFDVGCGVEEVVEPLFAVLVELP